MLAKGGLLGGGIVAEPDGTLREVIFGLPVEGPHERVQWFRLDFLTPAGHPVYSSGLTVDEHFRPVDADGAPVYTNLFAAGTTLAGGEVVRERSFDGVALATGYAVGTQLAAQAQEAA